MRCVRILQAAALAAALALTACVSPTPYQPVDPKSGGYAEERISQNQYRVVFRGNGHTPPDQVEQYLLRRAAELTLKEGYDWFRPTNRVIEGRVRTIQTSRGAVRVSEGRGYSGWDNYGSFFTRSGTGFLRPIWRRINPSRGEAVEASAEIVFGRNPVPQIQDAVDARKLLQKFGR